MQQLKGRSIASWYYWCGIKWPHF